MLTRLKVSGFKNLVGTDIRFSAFTCLAGPNGAGKSNLFDAVAFLSALAEEPLVDAALSVRMQKSLSGGDVRQLFHHAGNSYRDEMSFEAEMLVPPEAEDDLGQKASATTTFLRYSLTLAYRRSDVSKLGGLEIRREELVHITRGAAPQHLTFPHKKGWRDSVLQGKRSGRAFISTRDDGSAIEVHADKGTGGRNRLYAPQNLPRTVLSSVNALESPTALVARRELQSWRLLQLEPSALRSPDPFSAPPRIGADGSHMPAALARLGLRDSGSSAGARVSASIANRLAELTESIRSVRVDADEKRELLSLVVEDLNGTEFDARSLSDGTLRFLALAALVEDPFAVGVLCLEEPENGIHPKRVRAMLRLLSDLSVDTRYSVGPNNPLRQVIASTHSPVVTGLIPADSLIFVASPVRVGVGAGVLGSPAEFRALDGTWRAPQGEPTISKGDLLAYLNPGAHDEPEGEIGRRVIDRPELRQLVFPFAGS